jgi:4-aminobutyrate--pyruvate transaminase
VRAVSPRFVEGLKKLGSHPLVGEVQAVGLIGAVQLVKAKTPKTLFEPTQTIGPFMAKRAEHHGLICRTLLGHRVALCPPLVISDREVDDMLRRFTAALDDTAAMVKEQGLAAA